MNQYTQRVIREVEAWGDRPMPACACGCGEPVTMGKTGPKKYVNNQHHIWVKNHTAMACKRADQQIEDGIPIEKFRVAIKQLRAQKQLTTPELAEQGGQQLGWLNYYLYSKKPKTIGRATAEDFLRRLNGQGLPATKYQQNQAKKSLKKEKKYDLPGLD